MAREEEVIACEEEMNGRLRWDVSPTTETLCPEAVRSAFRIGQLRRTSAL